MSIPFPFPGGLPAFVALAAGAGLLVGAVGHVSPAGPRRLGLVASLLAGLVGALLAGIAVALVVPVTYVPALVGAILGAAALIWAFESDLRATPHV